MSEAKFLIDLPGVGGAVVGWVVEITEEDLLIVDYPSNPGKPVAARVAVDIPNTQGRDWPPVLLVFENGDLALPIVIGFVRQKVGSLPGTGQSLRVQRLVLDAEEEVLLRCGKSSVLLRQDGKIVIKGGEIVSRAARANKIQGATVRLN